jgi:hypothetical protein
MDIESTVGVGLRCPKNKGDVSVKVDDDEGGFNNED